MILIGYLLVNKGATPYSRPRREIELQMLDQHGGKVKISHDLLHQDGKTAMEDFINEVYLNSPFSPTEDWLENLDRIISHPINFDVELLRHD